MIKKISPFVILFLMMGTSSFAQNKVTIHGILKGDLEGYNHMYLYNRQGTDTMKIVDGKYSESFTFTEPEMKYFLPEYISKGGRMYQPYGILIAEPGDYYITTDKDKGLQASIVKGPPGVMLYTDFNKKQSKALGEINNSITLLYGDKWYNIDEKDNRYDAFTKSKDSLENLYLMPLLKDLVNQHPDSYATGYLLVGSRNAGTIAQKEALFSKLSPRMQKQGQGKKYGDYIQGLKSSGIGNMVSNFVLPQPNGKYLSFNKLKGKYILLDFWASWCSPCRQSFPRVREVYSHYKDDNFEIYSISIDENKADWLKAVKEESNPWPQTLDTKNISQSGFAVTAVPSTFLIAPNGKIIMKEVGYDAKGGGPIEKKIIELFGDKMPKKVTTAESNKKEKSTKAIKMVPMTKMHE